MAVLQRVVEKGQELLGEWRKRSPTHYHPSEIAREFDLTQEEDLKLRKADIRLLSQLEEYSVEALREKSRTVGFEENYAVSLKNDKKVFERKRLKDALGGLVWAKLEIMGVKTVEEFSHFTDVALEDIGKADPRIDPEDLKILRGQAKKFTLIQ